MCALGLASTALVRVQAGIAFAGLALSLVGTVWAAVRRDSRTIGKLLVPSILLTGLFAGLLLGAVRVDDLEDSVLRAHLGERTGLQVVITSQVRVSGDWHSATVTIMRCDVEGAAIGERAWLEVPPEVDSRTLQQGEVVTCRAKIEAPEGPSDSGYDQKGWLLQQGISIVLNVSGSDAVSVVGRRGGAAGLFDRLRGAAREHLCLGPDDRVNEVLVGVVTGDTRGIEKGWLEAFRRSGTAHMLSVSGLHVASLAAIMMGLGRLLRAPRWCGFVMAAAAAVLMIPFVGPSPPVIRAAIMIVIMLLGRWVGRGRDQWQILALAAVIILAMNPFALLDVGFQLSFSALTGIMALVPPLQRRFRRLPEGIAANIAVSLAAGIGTAPVALMQFDRTSLVSPLANMLVVPSLPIVTGLGMASVFAGFLWHGLSTALDSMASLPMMWTVLVSRLMAEAPVLERSGVGRALVAALGSAVVLPAALAIMGRSPRIPFRLPLPFVRRSLGWVARHRPRRRWLAVGGALVTVVAGFALGLAGWAVGQKSVESVHMALGGRGWPKNVELRVLDVGQGTAVLVRTPEHHTMLFDGGPKGCDLAGQLRSLGVRKLDAVVISHPHADHFAGLLEALPDLEVGMLVDHVRVASSDPRAPPLGDTATEQASDEAQQYLEFRHALVAQGCDHVLASSYTTLGLDGVFTRCFAPMRPLPLLEGVDPWAAMGGVPTGDELNAASLVCVLSVGSMDAIIPGDAEADTLTKYDLPPAEILVVPHHGSRGAVTESLLEDLGAKVAAVSVGAGNSFGHPDRETVSLLDEGAEIVVRTDTVGWVCCSLRGEQISITTERTQAR